MTKMIIENDKLVCALCGGKNVNEEILISIRVNTQLVVGDQHIDFYCEDCKDITELIWEHEF